ncbi:hypothetical protein MUU53_21320 [Rhizobium lemnae]|uniref:Uncharacterized protein n=1 Tax=Rhizobium lemnae TaxID=1214924 RepID=A0ABV8EBD4_9HYPH|nr:hypothetical protein [Rhizobium lemnae]MCJ8510424.1 hypothetical protein [Rhizobium lemnae]
MEDQRTLNYAESQASVPGGTGSGVVAINFDYPAPEGVLMPYELAMLQRLFNRALRKQGYAKTDIEAKMLATTMMDLYRRGLRDERKLRIMFAI